MSGVCSNSYRCVTHYGGGGLRGMKKCYFFIGLCVLFVLMEELIFGTVFISYMNFYTSELSLPITVKRIENESIAIAVILKDRNVSEYELARNTVSCYATIHRYRYEEVIASELAWVKQYCANHTDFMFLRHCVLSKLMSNWTDVSYVLFVDADMAVINPNHLIEEYLSYFDENTTILFYDRIMNHEVMAGSYLVRNTEEGRLFLQNWSKYEFRLPNSFHGSDNGAIHSVILEWSLPGLTRERGRCEELWKKARNYDDLDDYEVCVKTIFCKHSPQGVKIIAKGHSRWARDGWLTDNMWSSSDFIVHGWQKKRQDRLTFARWHSPLVLDADRPWDDGKCAVQGTAYQLWRYKDSFMVTHAEVNKKIERYIAEQSDLYDEKVEKLRELGVIDW